MRHNLAMPVRVLVALAAMIAIWLPAAPTEAQSGSPTAAIWIDSPTVGATLTNGTQTLVGGWAIDSAGPGAGISEVRVYLDSQMNAGGILVGTATYGKPRPDVATAMGNPNYTNSGYDLLWTPSGLAEGPHTLYVYARSTTSGLWSFKTVGVTAQGQQAQQQTGQYPRYDNPYLNNPYYNDRYRADNPYYNNPYYNDRYRRDNPYYNNPFYNDYYNPYYPYQPYQPYPPRNPMQSCILIYPPPPGC